MISNKYSITSALSLTSVMLAAGAEKEIKTDNPKIHKNNSWQSIEKHYVIEQFC